jgi:hypothetical protein
VLLAHAQRRDRLRALNVIVAGVEDASVGEQGADFVPSSTSPTRPNWAYCA